MAYTNYIPTVWAEAIERDLEKDHVFVANTNRQYEGKVEKLGDSVRVLGVGKPTITTVDRGSFTSLSNPETVEDSSVTMLINKMSHFNYKIDDIDKRQAVGGVMEALNAEVTEGLADEEDKAVAELAKDKLAVKVYASAETLTSSNVLGALRLAHQKLRENNVKASAHVTATIPPCITNLIVDALGTKDTDNSELLKKGIVAMYDGMEIKESNNVAKDNSGNWLVQVKTDRAIAYARPMVHTEAYRPESGFSDAVKGFILYGTKIVRPKEMFILNVSVS